MKKKPVALDDLLLWKKNLEGDKPKKSWWEGVCGFIFSPLFMLILGLVLGAYKDHFMASKNITQNMIARVESFEVYRDRFKTTIALDNAANRPSTLSELLPAFPAKISGGSPHLLLPPCTFTVEGVPVVVPPGERRTATIKGTLPLAYILFLDGEPQEKIRTAAISLLVRALDFYGHRYEMVQKMGEISVNSVRAVGWRNVLDSFPLFDERYRSGLNAWLPLSLPRGSQEAF